MLRMQDTVRGAPSWPPGTGWGFRGRLPRVLGEPGQSLALAP